MMEKKMLSRLTFCILLLLAAFVPDVFAQQGWTPPASQLPWNTYQPTRIPDNFSSIIGNGGQLIPESDIYDRGFLDYSLKDLIPPSSDFLFEFLGNEHRISSLYAVGSGFVTFKAQTPAETPTLAGGTYVSSELIAPYWTNLQTLGVPDGGIYWKVAGTAPNRVLTIEWRAMGTTFSNNDYTNNPGNFQVQLYEGSNAIEFHYGPNSIDRRIPALGFSTQGAWVGIKNQGQETPGEPSGDDSEKFLALIHPDQVINGLLPGEDTIAITRARTMLLATGIAFYPEVTAFAPSLESPNVVWARPSAYFTYSFPTLDGERIGYRITPLINDVAPTAIELAPAAEGNAYPEDSYITVQTIIRNNAVGVQQETFSVVAQVFRDKDFSTPVVELGGSVTGLGGLHKTQTITLLPTLNPNTPPITSIPGTYTVRVITGLGVDQDRSNDTLEHVFYISKPRDVAAVDILQPISNVSPLNYRYPVGTSVPIEVRFWNVGTLSLQQVPVGYQIFDAVGNVVAEDEVMLDEAWSPSGYRDVYLPFWTPTAPGRYYVRTFVNLSTDENTLNDTIPDPSTSLGRAFDVRYDIEIAAAAASTGGTNPLPGATYPDARPIPVAAAVSNNGMSDATNVPVRIVITDRNGTTVYDKNALYPDVPADGGAVLQNFPDFTPNGAGEYCVTMTAGYPQDPVQSNDQTSWCINVAPALSGTIHVGRFERFETIEEARDSIFYYGINGNLDLVLIEDEYVVTPGNNDPSLPALDMRGEIIGAGPNARITWKPAPGKTDVNIRLRTPSGYGIRYGQTPAGENPSGYITWDGGPSRALRFTLEQTNPFVDRAAVFFLGQGSHNYTIANSRIEPASINDGRKNSLNIELPRFNQSLNQFTFQSDLQQKISAGILLRNIAPFNPTTGLNLNGIDTLRIRNNVLNGNEIRDFGYGIASVGIGPLYNVGRNAYIEYHNRNNTYSNNTIRNTTRAGILLAYEKDATLTGNRISRVVNATELPHAAGIWATAGGNDQNNRSYSTGLTIEGNKISDIETLNGRSAGIWAETAENEFISPSNTIYNFPQEGYTDILIRNNMVWNYTGGEQALGIGLTVEPTSRDGFQTQGNQIAHSTIYTPFSGSGEHVGITADHAGVEIVNNIIALAGDGSNTALRISAIDRALSVLCDYNLFWVPDGNIGTLQNLSEEGYPLPSPPTAHTLHQWRYLTGMDSHSHYSDVTQEFVSTASGAVDLHIDPFTPGMIANNSGMRLEDVTQDIDGHPRGSAATGGRYDIGADEFTGTVRNNDIAAADIIEPFGWRASQGRFADAEYLMSGPDVQLTGRLHNVGGQPNLKVDAELEISYWNGTAWLPVANPVRTEQVDIAETDAPDFGIFRPATLKELGINDPIFGRDPNVTPIYRLRLVTGGDDYQGNNTFEKQIRFYVQRSGRKLMASVENFGETMPQNQQVLGNKLNADTLMAALDQMQWERADGEGREDYDLFDRTRWPQEALNFTPWKTMVWMQGDEAEGLTPWERDALKDQMDGRTTLDRAGLFIMGQEIARIHDVALNEANGMVADRDFVRNYLRAEYRGHTMPALFDGKQVRGKRITENRTETIRSTDVAEDAGPMPSTLDVTTGPGIAAASYVYLDQEFIDETRDTLAGIVSADYTRSIVFNAWDIRHTGRPELVHWSGAPRVVLAAIDYLDQYGSVLPVEVLAFEAYQTGREAVTVDWSTAAEVEVTAMEIERSRVVTTAAGRELTVGVVVNRVTPRGSASKGSEYRVVDRGVEPGETYEYRLVSVGLDGSRRVERSARVTITAMTADYTLAVVPNPVADIFAIHYTVPNGEFVRINIYDEQGSTVRTATVRSNGTGTVTFDTEGLASGAYTVRLESERSVMRTVKITVRK